ncbi:SigB/SigF/SigG family RNA polymerase sigma factor [Streptomyces triticagri]|uniref:SigB/SigF/SigG family RNA polymerase sigma factor n=1 Tax=Streptomyces triticagri TaxID=2293568 RepID=A0A372M0X4_9ACTN|nr:SigB/SigF/SigG family RNA polymerase sigma factor [Streptomyces triticagri]RFU84562.1 SigB/SigF/SigG family RNA polymerase sigma factor [Streptomyces triticagri]
MPVETSGPRVRRTHDDTPDTAAAFRHAAGLGRGPERDLLYEQLVRDWLPMAHRIAAKFRDRGENMDDLRQVAAVGLVKAVRRYDPGRGPFISYAVPTITGELRRHFRDHTWDVRVPRRVQELRNTVRRARRELMLTPGSHEPTTAQLAVHTGRSEDEVRQGLDALTSYRSLSLDAESDDGFSIADTLGDDDGGFDLVADRQAARQGLRHLPKREKRVLYLRFFEDMTQSRIAEELGISQMHVSRLISRSCRRVWAEALGESGTDGAAPAETETGTEAAASRA